MIETMVRAPTPPLLAVRTTDNKFLVLRRNPVSFLEVVSAYQTPSSSPETSRIPVESPSLELKIKHEQSYQAFASVEGQTSLKSSRCSSATLPDNLSISPHPRPISPPAKTCYECFYNLVDNIISNVKAELAAEKMLYAPFSPSTSPYLTSSILSPMSYASSGSSPEDVKPEIDGLMSDDQSVPFTKGKKYSLSSLSQEEIAHRKKEQNRRAAQRYRCRKNYRLLKNKTEIRKLESRNAVLRVEEASLVAQINALKTMMISKVSSM